jgi:hypothetical protein
MKSSFPCKSILSQNHLKVLQEFEVIEKDFFIKSFYPKNHFTKAFIPKTIL